MPTKTSAGPPRRRLPPITVRTKREIQQFLMHIKRSLLSSLIEHRDLYQREPNDRLRGQIEYFAHGVKILEWLVRLNDQRRNNG